MSELVLFKLSFFKESNKKRANPLILLVGIRISSANLIKQWYQSVSTVCDFVTVIVAVWFPMLCTFLNSARISIPTFRTFG